MIRPILILLLLIPLTANAGWDFSRLSIPRDQIQAGGPAKDGIPALSAPKFMSAGNAVFLRADDQVLGVHRNGIARAYPIRILSWHELVNDHFGNEPILVSW
jgi:hypothetical protein